GGSAPPRRAPAVPTGRFRARRLSRRRVRAARAGDPARRPARVGRNAARRGAAHSTGCRRERPPPGLPPPRAAGARSPEEPAKLVGIATFRAELGDFHDPARPRAVAFLV